MTLNNVSLVASSSRNQPKISQRVNILLPPVQFMTSMGVERATRSHGSSGIGTVDPRPATRRSRFFWPGLAVSRRHSELKKTSAILYTKSQRITLVASDHAVTEAHSPFDACRESEIYAGVRRVEVLTLPRGPMSAYQAATSRCCVLTWNEAGNGGPSEMPKIQSRLDDADRSTAITSVALTHRVRRSMVPGQR